MQKKGRASHSISVPPQALQGQNYPIHIYCTLYFFLRFLFLLLDEIREAEEEESELFEGLTSQQIFLWLQGLFLFALVWTVAGTIDADSRKKFDLFFRNLIMGMDNNNPRPKSVKLTKNNIFPERGNLVPVCFVSLQCLEHMFQTKSKCEIHVGPLQKPGKILWVT